MIEISCINKKFNRQMVLEDVSLEVEDGEILVVLGESGSGKSVLLKHLIGLIRPDSGSIKINAVDITKLSEGKLLKIRKDIGYLFQDGALFDSLTVYENVAFPLEEHTRKSHKEIKKKAEYLLEKVGLKGAEYKYPVELSGGMRKRAALARSVILEPKILFCDEPTSGLDPIKSRGITDLIFNLAKEFKTTTVITSHDIENSFRIADRLVLIRSGKLVFDGTQKEIKASKDPFIRSFFEFTQEA